MTETSNNILDKNDRYLGNPNLPNVGTTYNYSDPKFAKEMLKCKKKIEYFATNYFYITNLDEGKQTINLYPAQKRVLKAAQKHRFMVLLSSRQAGKALALDTPVPTPTGWTTMGAIKDGDVIFDRNGAPTNVVRAWDVMHDRPCYKMTFDNGESIIADEEHQWFTENNKEHRKGGSIKTTKNIYDTLFKVNSTEPNHRIPMSINGVEHSEQELPINPYVLGLWLGDGNSDSSTITVGDRDLENLKFILQTEQSQFDKIYSKTYQEGSNSLKITVEKNVQTKSLNTLLLRNNLLGNKHIPEQYFLGSREQRLDLIRGLIDSDGYIEKTGFAHFYNTNLKLAKDFQKLVRSIGYKATYKERPVKFKGRYCGEVGIVKFKPTEYVARIPFKKDRIKIRPQENNSKFRNRYHYIKNVESVDSVPVRCITVDSDDHLFLCGRTYIPTSNTTIMTIYSLWIACFEFDKRIMIIANKESTAIMILRRIRMAYEQLPNWLKPGVKQWGKTEVVFSNDSSITISTTSATAARGESANILILDEMAFIPAHILDEFWKSVIPIISSSRTTKIFAVSTPNGKNNKFFEYYTKAGSGEYSEWHTERIDWHEIPGRGKFWRNEMIQALGGEDNFAQEYGNCVTGDTIVTLREPISNKVFNTTISDLYDDS